MRKIIVILIMLLSALTIESQVLEPVSWTFGSEKVDENTFEVTMTADLEVNWHLYAMEIPAGGPVVTGFTFLTDNYSINLYNNILFR